MRKLLICALLFSGSGLAQPPGASGGGRGRGGGIAFGAYPTLHSPEVMSDGRVTFRFRSPDAKAVILAPEWSNRVPMAKGADGIWTVTIGPLKPDWYAYAYSVDGIPATDPSSGAVVKSQRPNAALELGAMGGWQNQFMVPGHPPESWEMTDIPHGAVAHVVFYSKAMQAYRDYYVYTPPGYDAKRSRRYPVLYLLHGAGENASGWSDIGRANVILDTLLAGGKAKEMIIVMPLGHPAQPLPTATDLNASTPSAANADGGRGRAGGGRGLAAGTSGAANPPAVTPYFTSLLTEIMPQVEKNYDAGNTKAMRAIAGLSMGGGQTMNIALLHPEMFNYVALFSPAVFGGRGGSPILPAGLTPTWAKQFRIFWVSCGTEDTLVGPSVKLFKAALKDNGVPFSDISRPGVHSYQVWKRDLTELAPLLFR